ncbi:hypothetical protein GGF46_002406 [Coemansia sp. RSA 552]|nr:hypothetical protein GGF46_002406 [Coemansia sp. RSA 552]
MATPENLDEGTDYYSAAGAEDEVGESSSSEEEMEEISSRTHGVEPAPPTMRFAVPGRQDVEISVVSLARYTFADPEVAASGPAPLEPAVDDGRRLMGVEGLQLAGRGGREDVGSGTQGRMEDEQGVVYNGYYDDDGLIAEFTEERSNRRLGRIAKALLLPDSYVEACYSLHEFMATYEGSFAAIESVQRNVFKCLKICARLSKLHGYSIEHMWQVIQQADKRKSEFMPARAHTIELWNAKLTNRIRMMAVSPAADGSAPQRLPSVPPPELLNAQRRDKLLPLPSMNVAALNDRQFDRSTGTSSASYYLKNPVMLQRPDLDSDRILPPISELAAGPASATPDMPLMQLSAPETELIPRERPPTAEDDSDSRSEYSVEEAGGELMTAAQQEAAESLASTREAELAIIEHQLRELERTPVHRMGPMMRAALNLLVEMRFRLQLGLPRSAVTAENALTAPLRIQGTQDSNQSSEAYGDGAMSEERVMEYVLSQISTSRRAMQQQQQQLQQQQGDDSAFGAPLYMLPHHAGMFYQGMPSEQTRNAYRTQSDAPRGELRRRRDADDDYDDDDEPSAPEDDEPELGDMVDADGDFDVESRGTMLAARSRSARNSSVQPSPPPRRNEPRRRRRMQRRMRRE